MKIFIKPEYLEWDLRVKSMLGRTDDGKKIVIPKREVTCHGEIKGWNVRDMLENGLHCVPLEKKNGVIIASRAEAMKEDFQELERCKEYTFRIHSISTWGVFATPPDSDLVCMIYYTNVTRARIVNCCSFFNVGETIRAIVLKKDEETYQVSLDRKNLYPTLQEVGDKYEKGQELLTRATRRINEHSCFCEVTPGIPGIISGAPSSIKRLKPGQKVWARVYSVEPEKGLKLDLIE